MRSFECHKVFVAISHLISTRMGHQPNMYDCVYIYIPSRELTSHYQLYTGCGTNLSRWVAGKLPVWWDMWSFPGLPKGMMISVPPWATKKGTLLLSIIRKNWLFIGILIMVVPKYNPLCNPSKQSFFSLLMTSAKLGRPAREINLLARWYALGWGALR